MAARTAGRVAALRLTHVQYALLSVLMAAERRGMSQSEAATSSGVDPMTTSQVLRSLEARELVARQPHPEDRRAHRVVITTNGRNLVRKAQPKVDRTTPSSSRRSAATAPASSPRSGASAEHLISERRPDPAAPSRRGRGCGTFG